MCLVCDRIKLIREGKNPYFVKELKTGYVVIGDYQHFKGYTVFLYKEHETELFHLDMAKRTLFMQETSVVGEAVSKAFGVEKVNFELLGNGDAHMHWHLFPRREGDLEGYGANGKGPVWWYPREKYYDEANRPSEEELRQMRAALLEELNRLSGGSVGH